jgi:superfamily II DNA or RNA helicase
MSFDKLNLKSTYNSEDDSIISDFYIPYLEQAVTYDRAVGFFSASSLVYAAQGLSRFIQSDGKMRLIIGHQIDDDEFEAIQNGESLKDIYKNLTDELETTIKNITSEIFTCRLKLLSWLIATNRLKIKFAIRRKGMYHEKIGILKDDKGNKIVFQGSANESQMALLPEYNFESISIYPSWDNDIYEKYGINYENRFEKLWNNTVKETVVVDVPSETYILLSNLNKNNSPPSKNIEQFIFDRLNSKKNKEFTLLPKLPEYLGTSEYELKTHQRIALQNWKSNSFNGILALATGAGKTITALHGATILAENQKHLALIIAVPYQNLAEQWCEVMENFSMKSINCYMSKNNWETELNTQISNFNLKSTKPFLAIVVVNRTLTSPAFQKQICRINPKLILFVGDECHHHSNYNIIKNLPIAKYRMGLSATPWSNREEEKQTILKKYYGEIISKYSIQDALNDEVLTPYYYIVHIYELSNQETEEYIKLSTEIGKMIAIREQGGNIDDLTLTSLYMKRARLIGSAENKFKLLENILSKIKIEKHTLFYCGDGSVVIEKDEKEKFDNYTTRDIEKVSSILYENGWKSSRFTADESLKERHRIIENFENGIIDAMVSIRVLDEGIDIPVCKQAFLLASSRNERQFIQRRGRILRKAPGKEFSTIHDFITIPNEDIYPDECLKNLVSSELDRLHEFAHVALNKQEIFNHGKNISEKYKIDWLSKVYCE